jgi:molybdate transport system substrate-binding protein
MISRLLLAAASLAFAGTQSDAAQLKLLVGGAMSEPFHEVGADFAKKTGHTLDFTVDTTGALQKKLRAGEKADIVLVSAPGMDALEKEHLVTPGTRVELASATIGVSVREGAGAPAPDLSTADAFKKAILAAKSISYVDPKAGGTSGMYLDGLFQRMGIADEVRKKTVFGYQGSQVASAVADGKAELGLTFISEMMPNKGVRIAGPLPDAIQSVTNYAVAIPVGSPNPEAARAFIQAMRSGQARSAIGKAGLTPIAKP